MLKNYCELSFYPIFNILVPNSLKKQSFPRKCFKNLKGIKGSKNYRKIQIMVFFHKIVDFSVIFYYLTIQNDFYLAPEG